MLMLMFPLDLTFGLTAAADSGGNRPQQRCCFVTTAAKSRLDCTLIGLRVADHISLVIKGGGAVGVQRGEQRGSAAHSLSCVYSRGTQTR